MLRGSISLPDTAINHSTHVKHISIILQLHCTKITKRNDSARQVHSFVGVSWKGVLPAAIKTDGIELYKLLANNILINEWITIKWENAFVCFVMSLSLCAIANYDNI